MENFFTSVRVKPLRSNDFTSKNYSLKKSLLHDERRYNETHIDKEKSFNNIIIGTLNYDEILEKINSLKNEYPLANKRTTIDVANYIFTVKKEFFDTDEKKQKFIEEVEKFLKKECGENSILSIVGHDDEDGFHVHGYTIPLHETTYKNRFGESKKTTINYRGKYSNTQEEINKFRSEKKTEQSKTGQLQTRWYEHINPTFPELKRGISNTGKTNIKPKEYREFIEQEMPKLQEEKRKIQHSNTYTLNETLQIEREQKKAIKKFENQLEELKKQQEILEEGLKKMKEESKIMKEKIKTRTEILTDLDIKKYQITRQLSALEKEELKGYRKIDIIEVAKLFGKSSYPDFVEYNGKRKGIYNAVDYLVYVEKIIDNDNFSFSGAFEFLQENFGKKRMLSTVDDLADNSTKHLDKKLSESHKVKEDLIKKQFDALGNTPVRITLVYYDEKSDKKPIVPGLYYEKDDEGNTIKKERFYNCKQTVEILDFLAKKNMEGYNIYITPIEYEINNGKLPIFIDDVIGDDMLENLKNFAGEPNYIQQTSEKINKETGEIKPNYQVVFFVENFIDYESKATGKKRDRAAYNEFFKELNAKFGDVDIQGLRHAMRLAGFSNKKPERDDFFTKIISINPQAKNNIIHLMNEYFDKKESKKMTKILKEKLQNYAEKHEYKTQKM